MIRKLVLRATVVSLGMLSPVAASAGLTTVFHVVPEANWNDGKPELTSFLPEGTVYLFRHGSYEVGLTAKVNEPIEIPAGTWIWIAEAPGFVSTAAGSLTIGAKPGERFERIVWPVVPACRISLAESPGWQGIERVDFVSLDRQATYPVQLAQRREVQVPAGRWLAYSVGPQGLVGMTRPRSCRILESLTIPAVALAPPGPNREELLVPVELPAGAEPPLDRSKLVVKLTSEDRSAVVAPVAAVWNGSRGSFFFLDLSTEQGRWLSVEHPELRSQRLHLPAVGGRASETQPFLLKPRRELRVIVDYQPKRAHRESVAMLLSCGLRRDSDSYRGESSCTRTAGERLVPGLQELRFPRLDDGQYVLHARIDDETVFGLGNEVAPYLAPEDDASPILGPFELRELEIHGHLLVGGKPVPGVVRLQGVSSASGPGRSFPTDEDLFYRWAFFGHRVADRLAELPDEVRKKVSTDALAASPVSSLLACDDEGYCRTFNVHSVFVGEGRLDLDLGRGGRVDFTVLEAGTGKPIEKATVAVPRQPALYFVDGRVSRSQPAGIEAEIVFTAADGRARLRLPELTSPYVVNKRGFQREQGEVTAPDSEEAVAVQVELEPEKTESATGFLRGPNGQPLAGAFLLAVDSTGRRRPECLQTTDAEGGVALSKTCVTGLRYVAFHPSLAIEVFEGTSLVGGGTVELGLAPSPPLVVQLRTGEGRPLPRTPVTLRLGDIDLGPNDLLLAATKMGSVLFYLSDDQGSITLRGVDPRSGPAVVWLPTDGGIVSTDLTSARAGESVVLEVP